MRHRTLQLKPTCLKFILLFLISISISYSIFQRNRFTFFSFSPRKDLSDLFEKKKRTSNIIFPPNSKQKSLFVSIPPITRRIFSRIVSIPRNSPNKFPLNRGINDVLSIVVATPTISIRKYASHAYQGDIVSRVIHSIRVPFHKSPRREKTEAKKKGIACRYTLGSKYPFFTI